MKADLREKGLKGDEHRDKARWKGLVTNIDPT